MFFNPGNISNSGNGGSGGGINITDIIPIISPLLLDATFDVDSNKIIFTKKDGQTFELDLSSLKGMTDEERVTMNEAFNILSMEILILDAIADTNIDEISFNGASDNLIITRRNGITETISLDIYLKEEDLNSIKTEIEGKATNLKMESEKLQLTSANGTILSEVSFIDVNNTIKELNEKIKDLESSTLRYKIIEE